MPSPELKPTGHNLNSAAGNSNAHASTKAGLKSKPRFGVYVILGLIVLATAFIRPGDTPWVMDEPGLVHLAWEWNHEPSRDYGIPLPFTPAPVGLPGTRGATYGPMAIWIYQLLMLITHHPLHLTMLRAVLAGGTSAFALVWLARTLRLNPWFAIVPMLSPWMWVYSRQLWDNTFCIPLSAICFASYADFLVTRRPWTLRIVALCWMAMLLTHLMSLAIFAGMLSHLVIFQTRWLLRLRWSLFAIILITAALAWPYEQFLFAHFQYRPIAEGSVLRGLVLPLLGAHHLTATGLGDLMGSNWLNAGPVWVRILTQCMQTLSMMAYPVAWFGIILAALATWQLVRDPPEASSRDQLCAAAICIWVCQILVDGAARMKDFPPYYNATWIVYAFFIALAIDWAVHQSAAWRNTTHLLISLQAAALLAVTLAFATTIARQGGSRLGAFGTSLGQQIAAVQKMRHYSHFQMNFDQWNKNPGALPALIALLPASNESRNGQTAVVQYRNACPPDAGIEVVGRPASTLR